MSSEKQSTVLPRHPMFRAMVVMGNGVAIGCGGAVTGERAHPDNGTGKDAGSSGSESSSMGGISGTGGASFIVGTGGTNVIGIGGAPVNMGTGGTTIGSGGGPVITGSGGTVAIGSGGTMGVRPACRTAQFDCSAVNLECGVNGAGWSLGDCACDVKRPLAQTDCAAGETFICRKGTADANGQALPRVVPFECSCIPTPQSCGVGCDVAFGSVPGGGMGCEEPTAGSILCGCAFVYLR